MGAFDYSAGLLLLLLLQQQHEVGHHLTTPPSLPLSFPTQYSTNAREHEPCFSLAVARIVDWLVVWIWQNEPQMFAPPRTIRRVSKSRLQKQINEPNHHLHSIRSSFMYVSSTIRLETAIIKGKVAHCHNSSSAHVKIVSRINQSKWLWLTDWYRSVAVALLQVPWCGVVAVVAEQKKDELGSYFTWNQLGKLLKTRETSTNPWCRTSWSDFLPLRSRSSSTTAVK